jgi:acyl-CoA thioesterase I
MTFRWVLSLAIGLTVVSSQAPAETVSPPCQAPHEMLTLDQPLTRTALALASGEPVVIVALGSSSTAGAGASSPEHSYPAQLEMQLRQQFPKALITVINRGANGEEAAQMVARMQEDVLDGQPDLVLWQVGTNAVLRDLAVSGQATIILDGLAKLKAAGTDVVLIDSQYSPKVLAKKNLDEMTALLHRYARDQKVGLFRRFAIMRHWKENAGITFEQTLSDDQLHMNDWSYGCIAKLMATSIVDAIRSPTMAKVPAGVR